MWHLDKQKVVVILITIFISVYTVVYISTEQLADQEHFRPKRQAPYDNMTTDVLTAAVTEPTSSFTESLTMSDIVVAETSLPGNFIESSGASHVVQYTPDILSLTESLLSINDAIMSSQANGTLKMSDFGMSISDMTPVLSNVFSTNSIHLSEPTMDLTSDYLSSGSNVFVKSTTALPSDLLSSFETVVEESQSYYLTLDTTYFLESPNLQSNTLPLNNNTVYESATVLLSDLYPRESDNLVTYTGIIHSRFISSNVSFFDFAFLDESLSSDTTSDNSFSDEPTIDLSSNVSPTVSSSSDDSLTVLQIDLMSMNSIISDRFSTISNTDVLSLNISVSEEFTADLFTSGNTIMDQSTTDFSPIDKSTLLSMITESTQPMSTTMDAPELSVSLSTLLEYGSIEPTPLSQTDYLSESFPLSSQDSLPWSGNISEPHSVTAVLHSTVDLTPVTTAAMQIIPATLVQEDTKTTILPTETTWTLEPTQSTTNGTSVSSFPETSSSPTTIFTTTPASLPEKSKSKDSGLTTGGKIALGILIPVAIICLILFGLFFYRRYRSTRGSLKTFLQPGVRYRTYSNAAYKDDEVVVDGSWRSLTDH